MAGIGGLGVTFMAMAFIADVFAAPIIALVPMIIVVRTSTRRLVVGRCEDVAECSVMGGDVMWRHAQFVAYGSGMRLPYGVPGGLAAVVIGTTMAWGFRATGFDDGVGASWSVDLHRQSVVGRRSARSRLDPVPC